MNITDQQAQTIINMMESKFDSHDFISKFIQLHQRDYEAILAHFQGRKNLAHAYIANFLRIHAPKLGIDRNARKKASYNVNGNKSENRIWNNQ